MEYTKFRKKYHTVTKPSFIPAQSERGGCPEGILLPERRRRFSAFLRFPQLRRIQVGIMRRSDHRSGRPHELRIRDLDENVWEWVGQAARARVEVRIRRSGRDSGGAQAQAQAQAKSEGQVTDRIGRHDAVNYHGTEGPKR